MNHIWYNNNLLNVRIKLILELIPKISSLILERYNSNLYYHTKHDGSILTKVDVEVESLLKGQILKNFGNDSIISEESDNVIGCSHFTWTIDPIDGTLPFICGVPSYSCLVSIMFEQHPVFGLIIFPGLNNSIYAIKGFGAFQKKSEDKVYSKMTPSVEPIENRLIWSCTDTKFFKDNNWQKISNYLKNNYRYNKTWGDAYGHFLVATGRINLMVDPNPILKIWDIAPLIPILTETNRHYITLPIGESLLKASGLVSSNNLLEINKIKSLLIY